MQQASQKTLDAIRKSINAAAKKIALQTNGIVEPKDLRLVISPQTQLRPIAVEHQSINAP